MSTDELKREEERKRDAAYDAAKRWQHIQETIAWAEANMPPHLRRNRPRTPNQQALAEPLPPPLIHYPESDGSGS
jgi:hypothetical protein